MSKQTPIYRLSWWITRPPFEGLPPRRDPVMLWAEFHSPDDLRAYVIEQMWEVEAPIELAYTSGGVETKAVVTVADLLSHKGDLEQLSASPSTAASPPYPTLARTMLLFELRARLDAAIAEGAVTSEEAEAMLKAAAD